jgi:starch-binding outer membrane protein, SusD/RagB family
MKSLINKKMKTNNNKTKNRLLIPFLITGFLASSCSLNIDETDSLITKGVSDVFNGVESPAGSLTTIYGNITGEAGNQENLYSLTEVSTDELLVPTRGTDWGDNGIWRTVHVHTWGPTHNHIVNTWNEKNGAVLKCTEVIDPLSKATPAQVAEAKFARAYNMWIVMDFWGQVPFRNPTDGPSVTPSVLSRKEAYNLVVKDLTDAIADLPASNPTAANKTRPVKATARFFLAKVKLNSVVYNGAYGASDLDDVISLVTAIETDGYSLVGGDYFKLFVGPSFTNTDVIWNVTAGVGNRMWNGLHYNQAHTGNSGGGWNGFSTLAEFYDKFEGPANSNSIGGGQEERRGYTNTLASTNANNQGFGFGFQFGQMYGWKDGAAVALKDRTGKPLVFTKEFAEAGLIGNNETTGARLLKYSPANGAFTEGVVMARFADAHLMRAEAILRKGNAGSALTEVNKLRALRANTSALASLDLPKLLDERGRELFIEGWRRNDMIRFGVFKAAKKFKPAGDGHTDLFPIPASALLSNPGLKQNPGY